MPTDATTGSWAFDNPSSGTQHFVFGNPIASVAVNTLLLYDRLFSVTKTMNSSTTEAVTVSAYARAINRHDCRRCGLTANNFLMIECRTALAATPRHNWTVCTYTDPIRQHWRDPPERYRQQLEHHQPARPAGRHVVLPAGVRRHRHQNLTQMQCSAAVATTGAIDFTIGHPIAFMPCGIANFVCEKDGLTTSISLERIFDDACLALLEICKSATTATTYTGTFTTLRG